jgi:ubiquinone biosynthesis UbiH/UbiF/VisC/COQ6 family hydroxylase
MKFDIVIVGCGMVGGILALGLENLGLKIAVVEQTTLLNLAKSIDHRAVAISFGNFQYIKNLFGDDPRFLGAEIKKIVAEDGVLGEKVTFCAHDISPDNPFGVNVLNQTFKPILYEKLEKSSITFFENADFHALGLESKLTIAADGRNSEFKNNVDAKVFHVNYNQTAYVATLQLKTQIDTAYERFFKTGPIALLPLPGHQASLIWSLENDLSDFDEALLKDFILIHLENILQEDFDILYQAKFPLSANFLLPPYGDRLLLIGDAAHAMHPVAGQGFNLGIRNVRSLVDITQKYLNLGLEIGSNSFLKEYWRETRPHVLGLMSSTHGLIRLFDLESKLMTPFKKIGMRMIEKSDIFKKIAARFASS